MRIEVLQWVLKVLQWTRWLRWRTFLARFPGHWFPKNDMHHMTCGFWRCFWVLKGRPARRLRLSPRWSWTTRREIVLPSALEAMDGYGWLWMAMDGYGWLWQFGLAGGPCSDANSYRSLGYQFGIDPWATSLSWFAQFCRGIAVQCTSNHQTDPNGIWLWVQIVKTLVSWTAHSKWKFPT